MKCSPFFQRKVRALLKRGRKCKRAESHPGSSQTGQQGRVISLWSRCEVLSPAVCISETKGNRHLPSFKTLAFFHFTKERRDPTVFEEVAWGFKWNKNVPGRDLFRASPMAPSALSPELPVPASEPRNKVLLWSGTHSLRRCGPIQQNCSRKRMWGESITPICLPCIQTPHQATFGQQARFSDLASPGKC